jgi:hypothetical protein
MNKRRKTMCSSCIYRTGELTRYKRMHNCHEHIIGGVVDETVACAGSCKSEGMELISDKTPNQEKWSGRKGAEAACTAIRNILAKGHGIQKMSDAVRLYKLSKGEINEII